MSAGDTDSLLAGAQRLALRYAELRAEAGKVLVPGVVPDEVRGKVRELYSKVREVDREVERWLEAIPEELSYQTLGWGQSKGTSPPDGLNYGEFEVFPGRVDVYPDYVTASAWNVGRVTRLLLASLALRLTAWIHAPVDYRLTSEYEALKLICEEIVEDIIASIPFHLGWHLKRKDTGYSGMSSFACGEEGPDKALPAMFLIWPLTCLKNHDMTEEEQRTWAKGRLKFIADRVGLKYAHVVNDVGLSFLLVDRRRKLTVGSST